MQPTWLKWELNTHVLATTPNRPVSRRRWEHDDGWRRQWGEQEHAQFCINHDVTSGWSCRRPENVSILSSLLIVLITAYIHLRFSLGKTIPFHMMPRVLYNHILIITKTTTATTKNITTTNVVIITITIQTALIIIIISLPQPLGCDNVNRPKRRKGGFVFSGFSEDKGLWGLLSLAGSQDLPYVNLILYLANHFHHHRHHCHHNN